MSDEQARFAAWCAEGRTECEDMCTLLLCKIYPVTHPSCKRVGTWRSVVGGEGHVCVRTGRPPGCVVLRVGAGAGRRSLIPPSKDNTDIHRS